MHRRTIREFMSAEFGRVRPDTSLRGAHALMRSAATRELIVMEGDRLAGVLSQLDLYLIQSLSDADPESAVVEEAMAAQPYVVSPDASLREVARTMWKERHDSAVVVEQEQVIGIFTSGDALHALAELLASENDEEAEIDTAAG